MNEFSEHSSILSPEIKNWLAHLTNNLPTINAIWLIGSRANGTFTNRSDWDFIAILDHFDNEAHDFIGKHNRADIDFLVSVKNCPNFETVPPSKHKTGSFESWSWQQISKHEAVYVGRIWAADQDSTELEFEPLTELGNFVETERKALLVWAR